MPYKCVRVCVRACVSVCEHKWVQRTTSDLQCVKLVKAAPARIHKCYLCVVIVSTVSQWGHFRLWKCVKQVFSVHWWPKITAPRLNMDSTEKSFWVSCTRLNGVKSALWFDVQQQNIHEFTEGRVGVYRPIRVLFNTPIIPTGSFKSAGTSDLTWPRLHWWLSFWGAVGAKWRYIRVQHWDFELADFDNEAAKPPLTVN